MVDVKDFGFVMDYALYDELPYYATGYIDVGCNAYVPPNGYILLECDPVSATIIGGSSRSNLHRAKVGLYSMVNTQTTLGIVGAGLVVLLIAGVIGYHFYSKPKRKLTYKG